MVTRSLLLLSMFGCGDAAEQKQDTSTPQVEGLSTRQMLVRASIDLRGVRPSKEELATVASNPDALSGMMEEFLQDERWPVQVRDLFGYVYLTRTEIYYPYGIQAGLSSPEELGPFTSAMGEETLRVLSEVARDDLPWTSLVTADWTMANEHTAMILPVDYPADGSGWQRVHYTDNRPPVGLLSGTNLWLRFTSTTSNQNRGRANAVSKLLLCNDFLQREVKLDRSVNLLDAEATKLAIQTNPGCTACHSSLDPLGSHLFGFLHMDFSGEYGIIEATTYHAERENWWQYGSGAEPAYFGVPTGGLVDLGIAIAADPRFRSCAVEQVFSGMIGKPGISDTDNMLSHLAAFESGGLTLRALVRSLTSSPEYRGETGVLSKMVRTEQYASQVEDLTGYRMTYVDYDLLQSDLIGIRLLAGGIDGVNVTQAPSDTNPTIVLAQERIAEAASWTVVGGDAEAISNGLEPRLFEHLTAGNVREQLEDLHLRVLSHDPEIEANAIDASEVLFDELMDVTGDPVASWAGVLSALLRDPDFLFY